MSFTKQDALDYHSTGRKGKARGRSLQAVRDRPATSLSPTRPASPSRASRSRGTPSSSTSTRERGICVAVISNGTAVLGLGDIGPLAGKPVMEGKAVLFKRFADIDVFDIEVDEKDPDKFVECVARLEPTFGGINLEDIKAPECFYIEEKLKARMKIPVFHDDQHGTRDHLRRGVPERARDRGQEARGREGRLRGRRRGRDRLREPLHHATACASRTSSWSTGPA